MMKKVLVISTSPRPRSNSDALADEFVKGALEAGNEVEKINVRGMDLNFCRGCLVCQKTGSCVISDDMSGVLGKLHDADAVCFATPIYYYGMSGQMKVFLDRCNPLYESDNNFRHVYLLTSAADDGANVPERVKSGLQGWIECFPKAEFSGSVFCGGVTDPGEIEGNSALRQAYLLGRSIR